MENLFKNMRNFKRNFSFSYLALNEHFNPKNGKNYIFDVFMGLFPIILIFILSLASIMEWGIIDVHSFVYIRGSAPYWAFLRVFPYIGSLQWLHSPKYHISLISSANSNLSITKSTNQSSNQSVNQSTNQSTNQSLDQPIT